jgi:hypothetical protein
MTERRQLERKETLSPRGNVANENEKKRRKAIAAKSPWCRKFILSDVLSSVVECRFAAGRGAVPSI